MSAEAGGTTQPEWETLKRPAREIPVRFWRATLFWPLTLDLPSSADRDFWRGRDLETFQLDDLIDGEADKLWRMGWREELDLIDHLPPGPDEAVAADADEAATRKAAFARRKREAEAYAEYAFFHDFVQRYLFRRNTVPPREEWGGPVAPHGGAYRSPLRLFRRTDVGGLTATLRDTHRKDGKPVGFDTRRFDLRVDRLSLYLVQSGIAMLLAEVSAAPPDQDGAPLVAATVHGRETATRRMTLADAQDLNDRLRRAHAPFLDIGGERDAAPAEFAPAEMAWRAGGKDFAFRPDDDVSPSGKQPFRQKLREMDDEAREIAPYRHFSWLLNGDEEPTGSKGWKIAPAQTRGLTWRHVADDRLAIASTIELASRADYDAVTPGDWIRLCYVDGAGTNPLPYAAEFLEKTAEPHFYDRFHYQPGENPGQDGSRFMMPGYALVAVGSGWFFENHIRIHMRRHYCQLMLIAQLELASLLSFSSRITLAVSDYDRDRTADALPGEADAERNLELRLQSVQRDMLHYVHRFLFRGVSGQLQPAEMYERMRGSMKLDSVYAEIKDELESANAFLSMRAAQRSTAAAERLNVVAAIGAVFGLAFSFLGMNVLIDKGDLAGWGLIRENALFDHASVAWLALGIFAALGYGLSRWLGGGNPQVAGSTRFIRKVLGWVAIAGIGLGILLNVANRPWPAEKAGTETVAPKR